MIFDNHANLKANLGVGILGRKDITYRWWGLNEGTIRKYSQEQEKHDIALDKLSMREHEGPFKGSK